LCFLLYIYIWASTSEQPFWLYNLYELESHAHAVFWLGVWTAVENFKLDGGDMFWNFENVLFVKMKNISFSSAAAILTVIIAIFICRHWCCICSIILNFIGVTYFKLFMGMFNETKNMYQLVDCGVVAIMNVLSSILMTMTCIWWYWQERMLHSWWILETW